VLDRAESSGRTPYAAAMALAVERL
jgi:hypothetical protein